MIRTLKERESFLLSNFAPTPVELDGIKYPTSEHAYQAGKVISRAEKERIAQMRTPGEAKRACGPRVRRSERIIPWVGWETYKIAHMLRVVRAKVLQNPAVAAQLLGTGTREIQEGNAWGDVFWGVDLRTGEGRNELGKILMQIRAELGVLGEGPDLDVG